MQEKILKINFAKFYAMALLIIMAGFLLYGAWQDAATFDESAHIPAGYAYTTRLDLRLNPEHPPLVKALAGITARMVENFNFPDDSPLWNEGVNEQWAIGGKFLYESGNEADKLIFASRIGPILLTLILGWYVFLWGRELLGKWWGLFSLFIFVFSPNFVGHGHLVTTDIGSTLGAVITLFYFSRFLKEPATKRLLAVGLALGIALLLKFTTVLLVPALIIATFIWALAVERQKLKGLLLWFSRLAVIGIAALAIVALVYQFLIANYPHEKQIHDSQALLASYGPEIPKRVAFWLIETPALRGLGHYALGTLMNLQRASYGNNAYFLGELSNKGWWYYFPVVYLIKETIPILILMTIALAAGLANLISLLRRKGNFAPSTFLKDNIEYLTMFAFIAIYWGSSVSSPLNIGVRHILPTVPLLWLLTLRQIKTWTFPKIQEPMKIFPLIRSFVRSWAKVAFLSILTLWYLIEFISVAPHFLSYFNQFAGGPKNGHKYVVDSNLDWGQDLKRLRDFVFEKNISKIKLDYFGGGNPRYYLGERYEPMSADSGPQKGWIAVSASFLQGETARPALGWDQPCCRYHWLDAYEPVARIGYSIFVYKID